jgi:uncharacterized membrane protein
MSDSDPSVSGGERRAPVSAGNPPPPPAPDGPAPSYTAPYPPYPYDPPTAAGLSGNVAAGLAYFTVIPAVFFLLLEQYRNKPLVRFHSWQSIFLFLVLVFIRQTLKIFDPMLTSATAFGISSLFLLLFFTAWLVATIKAFQGAKYQLPLIGKLAASTAASSSVR